MPRTRLLKTFPVLNLKDEVAWAECAWAQERNVLGLKKWSHLVRHEINPHQLDTAEYAQDALKKWKAAQQKNRAATRWEEIHALAQNNPHAEISFMVLAKAAWFRGGTPMGFCLIRRTWCNHLNLEFLAISPQAQGKIRGLGTGLLYQVACLAEAMKAPVIWGEATALSASFYEKTFGLKKVKDFIYLRKPTVEKFRNKYENTWKINREL